MPVQGRQAMRGPACALSSERQSALGEQMSDAPLVPPHPGFVRLSPVPYTFTGRLILRPINGAVDLLWAGSDDPQSIQCAALQMLIEHAWRLHLIPGQYRLPPRPIEIRDGLAPPVGSTRRRGTPTGPRTYWLARLPRGNYVVQERADGGSELSAGLMGTRC